MYRGIIDLYSLWIITFWVWVNCQLQWKDSQWRQRLKKKRLRPQGDLYIQSKRFHRLTNICTFSTLVTWISKCSETTTQIYYKTKPIPSAWKFQNNRKTFQRPKSSYNRSWKTDAGLPSQTFWVDLPEFPVRVSHPLHSDLMP